MRVAEYQNARLNLLADKVREEEKLAGDFIRIFPRPESRAVYNQICEDSGSDHWDLKLGNLLFGDSTEITQRDYEQFHTEMVDAENVSLCVNSLITSYFSVQLASRSVNVLRRSWSVR
jgi:hypothetical protein